MCRFGSDDFDAIHTLRCDDELNLSLLIFCNGGLKLEYISHLPVFHVYSSNYDKSL